MEKQLIRINQIVEDESLQIRECIEMGVVQEYRTLMRNNGPLTPLDVFQAGDEFLLADGWHRLMAAKVLGWVEIECCVHQGDRRDALLYALGCNSQHGKPLTRDEKRAAAETLLRDEEWFQWSNSQIARHCGLSAPTVAKIRDAIVNSKAWESEASREGIKNILIGKRRREGPDGQPTTYTPAPGRKPRTTEEKNLADLNEALETIAGLPLTASYAFELYGARISEKAGAAIDWLSDLGEAMTTAEKDGQISHAP